MDAIGERTEELKGEAYKYIREIHSNVDVLLKDVMLETLVRDTRHDWEKWDFPNSPDLTVHYCKA